MSHQLWSYQRLSNLFRRGELIPMVSQVSQKDICKGFPSLAQTEAGVTGSFSRLKKWSRDFPLKEFMAGAEIWELCGKELPAWLLSLGPLQVAGEAQTLPPAGLCGSTSTSLAAEEDCGRKHLLTPRSPGSGQVTWSCQWLCNAFGQCCVLTNIAAVWAGFNLGGIERKYL